MLFFIFRKKRMLKNSLYPILFLVIFSCGPDNNSMELKKEPFQLTSNITIVSDSTERANLNFGIWMFNKKKTEIDAIANWIGIKRNNKNILEPINIVWVDFKANNKKEATENITDFLFANEFLIRSGSSTGYFGLFENNTWLPQYKETWSDKQDPVTINNHGRLFVAHEIMSNLDNPVFVSTGAFSIESQQHYLISFNEALNKMQEVNKWKIKEDKFRVGNIVKDDTYTTFDHQGLKIFILN